MTLRSLSLLSCLLTSLCITIGAHAQSGSQAFGDFQVYYSVFNSTFVTPEIASTYQLNRARDRALVNISVTHTREGQTGLGLPAEVTGVATNLLQQAQPLEFREIDEGNTTYYIATVRHTNEEMYHFRIQVQPEGTTQPFELRFSQKLYLEH